MSIKPAVDGLRGGSMSWEILPPLKGSKRARARVIGKCVVTGELHAIECDSRKFIQYLIRITEGREPLMQDAFPEMDRQDREFLISGISPEGWKRMFR